MSSGHITFTVIDSGFVFKDLGTEAATVTGEMDGLSIYVNNHYVGGIWSCTKRSCSKWTGKDEWHICLPDPKEPDEYVVQTRFDTLHEAIMKVYEMYAIDKGAK